MIEESEEKIQKKVIFLGNSFVGKTSILDQISHPKFNPNYTPTIGGHSQNLDFDIDSKHMTLIVWDTAGQYTYKNLVPMYMHGSDAAILVFDISKNTSFKDISDWYDRLEGTLNQDIPTFLVGNKIDLIDKQEVAEKEARACAFSHESEFHLTSALTGYGINDLFCNVASLLLKNHHDHELTLVAKPASNSESKHCC
jgi:small GTP-binding protein